MTRRLCLLCLVATLGCPGKDDVAPPKPVSPTADAGASSAIEAPAQGNRLIEPQGQVTHVRQGTSTRVTSPRSLMANDAVETGDDGSAVLVLADGRSIELGPNGRFELTEDGSGLVLNVARGLVITRVRATPVAAPSGAVTLTISTPFGLTRVGDSAVKVSVDATRAEVAVQVGEIEVVSKSGDVRKLGVGKSVSLGGVRELPTITFEVVTTTGRVEYKPKDAKNYAVLNAKKPPTIAAGDSLRVVDGRLTLAPATSSTRVTVARGGEVQLNAAERGDGLERTALDLKKGELLVAAPQDQKTGLSIGSGVTLQSDLGAQYAVRRSGKGVEVQSLVGDLRITWQGHDDIELNSGATAVLQGAAPKVTEATRESVQLPTHNGLKVFHSQLGRVSLVWEPTEGVSTWRVAVATDAAFNSVVLDGLVHAPFVNVAVPAKGPLYWRVYEGTEERFRGNAAFGPEPSSQDLSRVKNVVPDGPDTTTIYYQDKPPTVTFTWVADEAAARYSVKVYREGELTKAVAERTVTEAQVSLPESTLAEGRYLWSVTSLDARGGEVKGGRLNKLHVVYDNAVPQLIIRSPRNGDSVKGSVKVVGIAPVGARVFVNGKPLSLDEKARFDTEVTPLAGGRLVFRMLNAGSEVYTVRAVRR